MPTIKNPGISVGHGVLLGHQEMKPLLTCAEIDIRYLRQATQVCKISSSREAFEVLFPFVDPWTIQAQESFLVLCAERGHKVLGVYQVSKGGVSGAMVDMRIVFAPAILLLASAMILCHNHPSGNLEFSKSDIALTKKLMGTARLHDMKVLDHLIVNADGQYASMSDSGLL